MANEGSKGPTPRPRRRRTDIDPNAPTPKVANERRRRKAPTASATAAPDTAPAVDPTEIDAPLPAPVAEATPDDVPAESAPTKLFHLPGVTGGPSGAGAPVDDVADAGPGLVAATATPVVDEIDPWLPVLEDRAIDPRVCPFLRAAGDEGLTLPLDHPDPSNRCAALRDVVPQSLRQQELVCLSAGHVRCPRYLRGAAVVAEAPRPVVRHERTMSPAVLGSLLVLVMAFSASIAFVLSRGGLELTPAHAAGTPEPTASAAAVAPPTPEPTPEPTPAPTTRPAPTSDRYALLTACSNQPNCWIYRVRSGDNLYSIANYFGVSLDSIYDRNPWVRSQGLRAGQELRLPPPTR